MREIRYVKGDATLPIGGGNKIILHCCNNVGAWGAGFVIPLGKRYPRVKEQYLLRHKTIGHNLGEIQPVYTDSNDTWVFNLIGQEGVGRDKDGNPPIRYDSIRKGLEDTASLCESFVFPSIHAPKFGAGLAGGDWSIIEKIIEETLCSKDISVTIYEFE